MWRSIDWHDLEEVDRRRYGPLTRDVAIARIWLFCASNGWLAVKKSELRELNSRLYPIYSELLQRALPLTLWRILREHGYNPFDAFTPRAKPNRVDDQCVLALAAHGQMTSWRFRWGPPDNRQEQTFQAATDSEAIRAFLRAVFPHECRPEQLRELLADLNASFTLASD